MQVPGTSWLLALVVASSGVSVARADCAMAELGPSPITRTGAKIPADGGILVGVGASTDHKPVTGDPSHHAYKATAAGKTVSLVSASLAPGLTVYRPKPAVSGAVALHDGKTKVLDVMFDKAKGAALAAPVVSAVALTVSAGKYSSTRAVAAVSSVPDAAVAIVAYAVRDDEHVPISFGTPAHDKTGATSVIVYASGGHCAGPALPSEREPAVNEDLSFAWVDAFGRLSPLSKPAVVKESP